MPRLECIHAIMENVQVAETRQHVRLQFDLEGTRQEQHQVLQALKHSSAFESVVPLGTVQTGMTPSDRVIPFVKANACGNDFLIIDGVYLPADVAEFSKRICDRHHGVGADGVEWLFPAPDVGRASATVQCRWLGSRNFRQRHPLRGRLPLLGAGGDTVHDPHWRRNQEL